MGAGDHRPAALRRLALGDADRSRDRVLGALGRPRRVEDELRVLRVGERHDPGRLARPDQRAVLLRDALRRLVELSPFGPLVTSRVGLRLRVGAAARQDGEQQEGGQGDGGHGEGLPDPIRNGVGGQILLLSRPRPPPRGSFPRKLRQSNPCQAAEFRKTGSVFRANLSSAPPAGLEPATSGLEVSQQASRSSPRGSRAVRHKGSAHRAFASSGTGLAHLRGYPLSRGDWGPEREPRPTPRPQPPATRIRRRSPASFRRLPPALAAAHLCRSVRHARESIAWQLGAAQLSCTPMQVRSSQK